MAFAYTAYDSVSKERQTLSLHWYHWANGRSFISSSKMLLSGCKEMILNRELISAWNNRISCSCRPFLKQTLHTKCRKMSKYWKVCSIREVLKLHKYHHLSWHLNLKWSTIRIESLQKAQLVWAIFGLLIQNSHVILLLIALLCRLMQLPTLPIADLFSWVFVSNAVRSLACWDGLCCVISFCFSIF